MMLNYVLIDNYEVYHIDHVFKITKEMLNSFFMDYAIGKKADGSYRGSESIENCVMPLVFCPACIKGREHRTAAVLAWR